MKMTENVYVPPPAPPGPAREQKTNGLGITALVLGILWLYWVGSILALIFGYVALRQIKRANGWQGGRGLAIAGVVLGWVGVGTLALVGIVAVAVADDADDAFDDFDATVEEADAAVEEADDEFTGDGIPPEEFEAATRAECTMRFNLSDRYASAVTFSGRPATIDLAVVYTDGRTETYRIEWPGSDAPLADRVAEGTSVFVGDGAETCTVTDVLER